MGGRDSFRAVLVAGFLSGLAAAQAPPVPAQYQDLYSSLSTNIANFQNTINASWNQVPYPVAFSAELTSANSNLGATLLEPLHYTAVLMELDGLKALGIKAASVTANFPVLDPWFYQNQSDYLQYRNFYTQLASDVHARGLKLVVESRVTFSQDGFSSLNVLPYYNSLTLQQYQDGRARTAVIVAQQMKPDYLSVVTEPDTEAAQSGKPQVGTVSGATGLLVTVLNALQQAGVRGVQVGAGVGTWLPSYMQYIQSFAATPIQYVDMHVYPVNGDYLTRTLQIADTAHAFGKQVAISETWLYKVRDSELGTLNAPLVFARDSFDFWAPLDASFLNALGSLAQYKQLLFVTPFYSTYFRAYLDYTSATANLSPAEMQMAANSAAGQSLTAGLYTTTGVNYASLITRPPDRQPPATVTGLYSLPSSTSSVFLSWNAATDNVGVAGYKVYRNRQLLATTVGTQFSDGGLPAGAGYVYTVVAYDVQGNTSAPASVTGRTQNAH